MIHEVFREDHNPIWQTISFSPVKARVLRFDADLLAGGSLGAALAIKRYLEFYPERGTVVLFGCPDEEQSGAKVIMAREGLFNGIDLALTWHPSDLNIVPFGTTSATCDLNYKFKGEAAHVAAGFSDKYNALDAAELMNVGLQYLRNRVARDAQIDYAFADAGKDTPNVIQDSVTVHPSIAVNAKVEHTERTNGHAYVCPLPDDYVA